MRFGRRLSLKVSRPSSLRRLATACALGCLPFAVLTDSAAAPFEPPRIDRGGLTPTAPVDAYDWPEANPIGQSVANRPRLELDPIGVSVGPVRFYPSVDAGFFFDDNIRKSENGKDSDLGIVVAPKFLLLSEKQNLALEVSATAEVYRHFHIASEDREDISFAAQGAYQANRELFLLGEGRIAQEHETRTSADAFGTEAPVQLTVLEANIGVDKRFGAFGLLADAGIARFDVRDVLLAPGNLLLNNDDRDRIVYRAGLEPSYRPFGDTVRAYARFGANAVRYDAGFDDLGFGRDSQGLDARVGALMNFGGIATVDAYTGYLAQFYEDDGIAGLNSDQVSALLVGARATANISGLTSLTARVDRRLAETTIAASPGTIETRLEAGVDHELLRNLVLSASVSGRYFQFVGADREDLGLLFRLGGVYMINRHFGLRAGFEHEDIRSGGVQEGVDLTSNRIMLRLTARP